MNGCRSNTTLTRILYLKIFLPCTWVLCFFLFYFEDIFCFFSMINSHIIRQREIQLCWLFRYRDCLFLTLVVGKNAVFFTWFMNNENLYFLIFSDCLLAENHSLILISSSLFVLNNVFKLLRSKNKLVSSANIIGTNTFEELGRSFTCNKNNNRPSIVPCGIPRLIYFPTLSVDSVIFIYCFLPFK